LADQSIELRLRRCRREPADDVVEQLLHRGADGDGVVHAKCLRVIACHNPGVDQLKLLKVGRRDPLRCDVLQQGERAREGENPVHLQRRRLGKQRIGGGDHRALLRAHRLDLRDREVGELRGAERLQLCDAEPRDGRGRNGAERLRAEPIYELRGQAGDRRRGKQARLIGRERRRIELRKRRASKLVEIEPVELTELPGGQRLEVGDAHAVERIQSPRRVGEQRVEGRDAEAGDGRGAQRLDGPWLNILQGGLLARR